MKDTFQDRDKGLAYHIEIAQSQITLDQLRLDHAQVYDTVDDFCHFLRTARTRSRPSANSPTIPPWGNSTGT